jgi:hypothetical protein
MPEQSILNLFGGRQLLLNGSPSHIATTTTMVFYAADHTLEKVFMELKAKGYLE